MTFGSHVGTGEPRLAGGRSGIGPFLLRRLLRYLRRGQLTVRTPAGEVVTWHGAAPGPEAVLNLHRWRALRRLALRGDLGFAEAYLDGDWSSPDLTALIALGAENIADVDRLIAGTTPARLLGRLRHLLSANTRSGSRRNIAFHYDLGNAFYARWLDTSMTYSAVVDDDPRLTLEEAQQAKRTLVGDMLRLEPRASVLEIGCGWGSLALELASRQRAQVTAITLSSEQLTYARAQAALVPGAERPEFRLQDYRDVDGRFDRIVSIEMLEAVGEPYWPTYFQTLRRCLKPGGRAVIQVITIDEARYASYQRSADFIQRYVFPGGMLPTKAIVAEQASRAGLDIAAVRSFGSGYVRTLADWRQRFNGAWGAIEPLGFDARFRRLWDYYLCYCEAGFRTGLIDVSLYELTG